MGNKSGEVGWDHALPGSQCRVPYKMGNHHGVTQLLLSGEINLDEQSNILKVTISDQGTHLSFNLTDRCRESEVMCT